MNGHFPDAEPCGRCPVCAEGVAPTHRFCSACGARLQAAELDGAVEKRHLTVLFCDLVDSTALAGAVDAEDLREIFQAYQASCLDIVAQHDGHVAQVLGDGLLVYFGYPRAQEAAAARALLTARGIVAMLPRLSARLRHLTTLALQVRIGIHTGMVVVGEVGRGERRERLAIGEVPHIAARLQAWAQANDVVVSEATRRAIREDQNWQALGPLNLRGVNHPVVAYRLPPGPWVAQRTPAAGRATLMGRPAEMALLDQAWRQVQDGPAGSAAPALPASGRSVLITGEPGLGKSHLLQGLCRRVQAQGARVWVWRCSPHHQASEWHAVLEGLEADLGLGQAGEAEARHALLCAQLPAGVASGSDDARLLARLLRAEDPAQPGHWPWPPAVLKQRSEAALLRCLRAWAEQQPLLLAIEDLHWADPSTRALARALQAAPGAACLLVMTQRPPSEDWGAGAGCTQSLVLDRLKPEEAEALLWQCTEGKPLPTEVQRRILENTDGVPLFIEEFTRTVLESDLLRETAQGYELRGPLPLALIPDNLRDSLSTRLDRLEAGRAVARRASVIGRRFERALLQALCGNDPALVEQGLSELLAAGLVRPLDESGQRYEFKHALVQAAAYDTLLRRDHHLLHGLLATELARQQPELVQRQPEWLAHHHTEAQQWLPAVQLWLRAGQQALSRSANLEALSHLRAGLALIRHLSPDEGARLELSLLGLMAPALKVTRGFTAPELETLYARVEALCQVLPDRPEMFVALNGLWGYRQVKGQQQGLIALAQQNLAFVERAGTPTMLAQAVFSVGVSQLWSGQFAHANDSLQRAVQVYDPQRDAHTAQVYGSDPRVAAECYRAYALFAMGLADQAEAAIERAADWALRLDHPFSRTWGVVFRSGFDVMRHEPEKVLAEVEHAIAHCREVGHVFWLATTLATRAWAWSMTGRRTEGIEGLRSALAFQASIGAGVILPQWRCKLAEALMLDGQLAQAELEIESALATSVAHADFFCRSDILRVRGEIARRRYPDQPALAHARLQEALLMAQQLGYKPWALRIATSLWRLAHAHGTPRPPLAALLAEFQEGQGTWALREARAALQSLPVESGVTAA
ncbi:adenylate/guanylate cyclase domain-containing protein [Curvibacter sp. HBC61]|uniref:Adenylate/guanylate cyclase domain-containing protein n=1 Tax=Curvibacter cyanobacteriorum TaxID=3026422 RepID=A0ABT5N3M0_9BURK|nr:adenylate/guanylate cyclase domain-containing protein [Curvibacter sp. HBC61]MDD0840915.1 adenylate/guanylate cyclase domain-containing protein [Curvibacter sp. HBC61]